MSREVWFSNFKKEPGRGPDPWLIIAALVVAGALVVALCR